MRKTILSLIGISLLVGAFFMSQKIASNKKKQKPKVEKVKKVAAVSTAKNSLQPISITTNGVLKAKNRLSIFSETQGIFKKGSHLFRPGQIYKKGETLVSIDATEYFSIVQASRSNFQQLLTSLIPDLTLDYPTVKDKWLTYLNDLNPQKSLPELPGFENNQEKYFITGRGLVQAYFNIKNQEERLKKYRIVAPFTGTLTTSEVTEGSLIRQGQLLGEFIDTSVYELEINLSQKDLGAISTGQKVLLKSLESPQKFTGKISRINKSINTSSQTISIFVEVRNPKLTSGQYLEAIILGESIPNAIKLNRKLLRDESSLFIVVNRQLKEIAVTPVYFFKDEVIVTGIPEGSLLLQRPIPSAFNGMLVEIQEDASKVSSNLK